MRILTWVSLVFVPAAILGFIWQLHSYLAPTWPVDNTGATTASLSFVYDVLTFCLVLFALVAGTLAVFQLSAQARAQRLHATITYLDEYMNPHFYLSLSNIYKAYIHHDSPEPWCPRGRLEANVRSAIRTYTKLGLLIQQNLLDVAFVVQYSSIACAKLWFAVETYIKYERTRSRIFNWQWPMEYFALLSLDSVLASDIEEIIIYNTENDEGRRSFSRDQLRLKRDELETDLLNLGLPTKPSPRHSFDLIDKLTQRLDKEDYYRDLRGQIERLNLEIEGIRGEMEAHKSIHSRQTRIE